jgi:hypothetical protein
MRKRRPNYRLVKIHRCYTVEEAARLLGTHKNTVRAWVRAGLPTCDSKRPTQAHRLGVDPLGNAQVDGAPGKSRACQNGRKPQNGMGHVGTSLGVAEHDSITSETGDYPASCLA